MSNLIKDFNFNQIGLEELNRRAMGSNWPVVYLLHNNNSIYIGETSNASKRMNDHLHNEKRNIFDTMSIVLDKEYNKSVILDYEQKLIKCIYADSRFKIENIQNKNQGQSMLHDYYMRSYYKMRFNLLWNELINKGLANNSLLDIENKDIFKYSPYSTLTEEQADVSNKTISDIAQKLQANKKGATIINGCAGTGKTIVAINMINQLLNGDKSQFDYSDEIDNNLLINSIRKIREYENNIGRKLKIGFVFPMTGIRKTVKKVFKTFRQKGFKANMVISPYEVKTKPNEQPYDILFVDEAHRLKKFNNLLGQEINTFRKTWSSLYHNKKIENLDGYKKSNQLEWILDSCKYAIIFYDKDQSVRATDISSNEFENTINRYEHVNKILKSQMRCEGGASFIDYVKDIFNCSVNEQINVDNYEFLIFDDVNKMFNRIKTMDAKYGLSRMTAGFSWKWKTKDVGSYDELIKNDLYDIKIGDNKYIWNMVNEGWINSPHSVDTIGCIHTTQGFDLNYVGVIFGEEIDYDPIQNTITIDISKFCDKKATSLVDRDTSYKYILNAYLTMMFRGIKGCYIYACNKNLQEYLKKFINKNQE